jgi:sorting nexin-25
MALTRKDVTVAAAVSLLGWAAGAQWFPLLRYTTYAFLAGCGTTALGLVAVILLSSRPSKGGGILQPADPLRLLHDLNLEKSEATIQRIHEQQTSYKRVALYPPEPDVSNALDDLLEIILREYVASWYSHISHSPSFTNAVDSALRTALASLRDKLLAVDLVEVTVSKIVPILTGHLKDAYDAEKVIRGEDLRREVTESEHLDLAVAAKYKNGQLHPAASLAYSDTKLVQQQYLRDMVVKILPDLLPPEQRASGVVEVLVREIVACAVLSPVMQMLSDPDFWNQLMENYVRLLPAHHSYGF